MVQARGDTPPERGALPPRGELREGRTRINRAWQRGARAARLCPRALRPLSDVPARDAVGGEPAPPLLLGTLPGARPGRLSRRALPLVQPTAIVDPGAVLDPSGEIGPFVVIDGLVASGPRTRVLAGAYLTG